MVSCFPLWVCWLILLWHYQWLPGAHRYIDSSRSLVAVHSPSLCLGSIESDCLALTFICIFFPRGLFLETGSYFVNCLLLNSQKFSYRLGYPVVFTGWPQLVLQQKPAFFSLTFPGPGPLTPALARDVLGPIWQLSKSAGATSGFWRPQRKWGDISQQ